MAGLRTPAYEQKCLGKGTLLPGRNLLALWLFLFLSDWNVAVRLGGAATICHHESISIKEEAFEAKCVLFYI